MTIKEDMEHGEQKGNREPLFREHKSQLGPASKGNPWMVYFTTFAGYSSPTQYAITEDLNLPLADTLPNGFDVNARNLASLGFDQIFYAFHMLTPCSIPLFGSILTFSAMIGAITSGPVADFIGLKIGKMKDVMTAMRVSSAFCIAGWLLIYFSQGPVLLDIGRPATGYGMGVFSFVVPVFIAEIAPKDIRGALTSDYLISKCQFMITAAVSVAYIIGTVLPWRDLALTEYQSNNDCRQREDMEKIEAALLVLHGKDADISPEADEIQVPMLLMFDIFL
ncbi:hypothetical protein RIF29_37745 [Crotalaria pallida]|uniref:Major facilitator superfamily (MFS) profile domain-containing protein n=1 Tax=Crotalaria pallida TaxID=3830 RepID=A0AAN9E0Y3_CROPI